MEFTQVVRSRYSCKQFDGRPVEPARLKAILEAGRLAPTAKNLQEQRIYVVQSEEGLAALDRVTRCRYGAATVLVVAYDRENVFTYPGGQMGFGCGGCRHRCHTPAVGRCQRRGGQLLGESV